MKLTIIFAALLVSSAAQAETITVLKVRPGALQAEPVIDTTPHPRKVLTYGVWTGKITVRPPGVTPPPPPELVTPRIKSGLLD